MESCPPAEEAGGNGHTGASPPASGRSSDGREIECRLKRRHDGSPIGVASDSSLHGSDRDRGYDRDRNLDSQSRDSWRQHRGRAHGRSPPGGRGDHDRRVDKRKPEPVKNDYSQHFVDSGERPQNFVRDTDVSERFEEFPKLKLLVQLKEELIRKHATPPMFLQADLKTFDLQSLGARFDVVYIDPPWEEYARRGLAMGNPDKRNFWTFEEIKALEVEKITETPSFLFLWCGSCEALEQGRQLLRKWGFRRCEDICWVKTNKMRRTAAVPEPDWIFQHTKEHCLMGIKGTVRRNKDGHIIHTNIDTDVIISEEPPPGSCEKPTEMYQHIEHFCLGLRRLELFGEDHNIRPGWVTIGDKISSSNFSAALYASFFTDTHLLSTTFGLGGSPSETKFRAPTSARRSMQAFSLTRTSCPPLPTWKACGRSRLRGRSLQKWGRHPTAPGRDTAAPRTTTVLCFV
eukprot:TRINITY_DN1806_c0_g1_i1.p1 TRINITY_DN1806_c0_g1~~TRINITY_DN1806_c0_g1_i1.p1  ORF type:complete len:459 (-),score=62.80 TRINITY_DN1806_c0_g1_i1:31-1407(-)